MAARKTKSEDETFTTSVVGEAPEATAAPEEKPYPMLKAPAPAQAKAVESRDEMFSRLSAVAAEREERTGIPCRVEVRSRQVGDKMQEVMLIVSGLRGYATKRTVEE